MAYTLECGRCTQSGAVVVRIPRPRKPKHGKPQPVAAVFVRCEDRDGYGCGHEWRTTQAGALAAARAGVLMPGDYLDIDGDIRAGDAER